MARRGMLSGNTRGSRRLRIYNGDVERALRTYDALPRDAWIAIDSAVQRVAEGRFRGVRDLIEAGLTYSIPNAMAKTMLQWTRVGQVNNVERSMDGVIRGQSDMPSLDTVQIPLHLTHADFDLNLRELSVSREGGFPFDTILAS